MSKSAGNVREFPYANNAVDIHSHVNKPGDHVEKIFSMGVPSMPSVEEIQRRIQELMKMQQVDPGAFIVDHTGPKTTFPWGGITPPDFVPVGPGVLPQPISPVPSIPEVSKHDISELKKSLQEEIRGLTDKWKRDETLLTEHVDILSKKLKPTFPYASENGTPPEQLRQSVIDRFGEFNYRRFRLYLWGATYEFLSGSLDCYRMIIDNPVHGA